MQSSNPPGRGKQALKKSILKWLSKDGHFCVNRVSEAGKLMYFLRYGAAWACLRLNDGLWKDGWQWPAKAAAAIV